MTWKISAFFDFQTRYIAELTSEADYGHDLDAYRIFDEWHRSRSEGNLTGFRDLRYRSLFTGTLAPGPRVKFMDTFDDSKKKFLETV